MYLGFGMLALKGRLETEIFSRTWPELTTPSDADGGTVVRKTGLLKNPVEEAVREEYSRSKNDSSNDD